MGARAAAEMILAPYVSALKARRKPVRLGSLRSTSPVSSRWGYDRGQPVDRWYIERFVDAHRSDITGRVLEVKDSMYTERFGHALTEQAVLDIDPSNERATHVADLATGEALPSDAFDCFVLTQTLQLVFDAEAALRTAHRVLAAGGVLLMTVPVTSRVVSPPLTDYWRFTPLAIGRLLDAVFGDGAATVNGRGNVLSQVAFLEGLAVQDVTEAELEVDDPRFPLIVTARAVKAG